MSVHKNSEITIKVKLDENNVPVEIKWTANEAGMNDQLCKALMLSLWDGQEKNTLRIDLWNKEMTTDEMKQFFHQSMLTMADTFERATGEEKISNDIRDFCYYFAEKMKLIDAPSG
ncbi:MAG: gliding motility protein GldC [Bacteroidota bacterium]